jgi:hypothetical protein
MKTAISLSDALFEKAEKTAYYMGIKRSRLFVIALEDYIAGHDGEIVTKKLNDIYGKINQDEFARDMDVGLESLRNLIKHESKLKKRLCYNNIAN